MGHSKVPFLPSCNIHEMESGHVEEEEEQGKEKDAKMMGSRRPRRISVNGQFS